MVAVIGRDAICSAEVVARVARVADEDGAALAGHHVGTGGVEVDGAVGERRRGGVAVDVGATRVGDLEPVAGAEPAGEVGRATLDADRVAGIAVRPLVGLDGVGHQRRERSGHHAVAVGVVSQRVDQAVGAGAREVGGEGRHVAGELVDGDGVLAVLDRVLEGELRRRDQRRRADDEQPGVGGVGVEIEPLLDRNSGDAVVVDQHVSVERQRRLDAGGQLDEVAGRDVGLRAVDLDLVNDEVDDRELERRARPVRGGDRELDGLADRGRVEHLAHRHRGVGAEDVGVADAADVDLGRAGEVGARQDQPASVGDHRVVGRDDLRA